MDLGLDGRRAVVTGASGLIGSAVVRALLAEGAHVGMMARRRSGLESAAADHDPARITLLEADTTDDAAVHRAVNDFMRRNDRVDVLINAAATPASRLPAPALTDLDDDTVRAEFETKVLGYLRTSRAVAPSMVAQGWGRIVNVSGLNARLTGSIPGTLRNVSVAGLTKNLADELGPHGINVTTVHPGRTVPNEDAPDSTSHVSSIGRDVAAHEVADVIVFLASPRSVAINGDAIPVGGGWRGAVHY